MELKHGYRVTDVGALPAEWGLVPFSELLAFRNGVNADKAAYGDGVPFINVLEVITKSHLSASDIPGRISLSEQALAPYAVRRGDVVFNRTSETQEEVGLAAVYNDDELVVFGGFVIRGRPTTSEALDPIYSGYALRSKPIRRQVIARGQGAIRANIGQQDLRSVLVPRPPLPEQKAIAAALSDVDALLGALHRLVAKKRDLRQAAMQQLLTGQSRLPGFSDRQTKRDTDVGRLPSDWQVVPVGDIASVKTGPFGSTLHEEDYVADGTPIITVEHLGERGIRHVGLPMVSDADRRRLSAYSLMTGDIVFSRVGSIDRNALVSNAEEGWLFSGRLLRVRPSDERVHTRYLSYHFHSEPFKQRVRSVAVGQTMASLNTQILKSVLVAVPPVREQEAIGDVLFAMDAELSALEQRRDKTRLLKQGMMQELLTGRTRLV